MPEYSDAAGSGTTLGESLMKSSTQKTFIKNLPGAWCQSEKEK